MLRKIKMGESQPDLVEGMACPGGCVGGPGTLSPIQQTSRQVIRFSESALTHYPACELDIESGDEDPDRLKK